MDTGEPWPSCQPGPPHWKTQSRLQAVTPIWVTLTPSSPLDPASQPNPPPEVDLEGRKVNAKDQRLRGVKGDDGREGSQQGRGQCSYNEAGHRLMTQGQSHEPRGLKILRPLCPDTLARFH